MTYQMNDEEYCEYLRIKKEHEEFKRDREFQMEAARRMLTPNTKGQFEYQIRSNYSGSDNIHDLKCFYSQNSGYYCDLCLPGWILGTCPFGLPREYSK